MSGLHKILGKIENSPGVLAVKSGLIMVVPVLIIGSATLVFEYFPIAQYQHFIETVLSGRLFSLLNYIYRATFGMLSVYLTCAISYSLARQNDTTKASLASPITAFICFFIFSGVQINSDSWNALGVKGVFIAIVTALLSTNLFSFLMRLLHKKVHGYTVDTDVEFNHSVSVIIPASIVVIIFAIFNSAITDIFGVSSIFELFVRSANSLFIPLGRCFLSGILVVLVSSALWLFGIHGSDALETVMDDLFTPAININISLSAAGKMPTEIFTKQFFDVFVLMGGCGTAICLLISILIFSKRQRNRRISKLAAVPMLFNINELMIFGYPIIFNPTLMIPFIVTPIFSFCTTYFAMRTGIVPLTVSEVNWTAPILLSGYMATKSIAGSALQLFNIICGVFIYRPFIIMYDRKCNVTEKVLLDELIDIKKHSEETLESITLTALTDKHGTLARSLVSDLKYAISKNDLMLYYQPQFNNCSVCTGAESLLRWNHPLYGMIYPPLIIQLARESGMLPELECMILKHAVEDAKLIRRETGFQGEIGINISSATLQSDDYLRILREFKEDGNIFDGEICLEITEQTAFFTSRDTSSRIKAIKDLGYRLAIDDFSMGHTSLTYLQECHFDTVKLDGSLVKEMISNERTYDIIMSITSLADSLGFSVIAEYVESEEQQKMLEDAGCYQYQGYLFSKPITCEKFITTLLSDTEKQITTKQ